MILLSPVGLNFSFGGTSEYYCKCILCTEIPRKWRCPQRVYNLSSQPAVELHLPHFMSMIFFRRSSSWGTGSVYLQQSLAHMALIVWKLVTLLFQSRFSVFKICFALTEIAYLNNYTYNTFLKKPNWDEKQNGLLNGIWFTSQQTCKMCFGELLSKSWFVYTSTCVLNIAKCCNQDFKKLLQVDLKSICDFSYQ